MPHPAILSTIQPPTSGPVDLGMPVQAEIQSMAVTLIILTGEIVATFLSQADRPIEQAS